MEKKSQTTTGVGSICGTRTTIILCGFDSIVKEACFKDENVHEGSLGVCFSKRLAYALLEENW